MIRPKVQIHLPNLYVGGIEQWALTLMNGLPGIDWYVSTPAGALAHLVGVAAFSKFTCIREYEPSLRLDARITTWGISGDAAVPTCVAAHSAFERYGALLRSVRHDYAVAVSKAARQCFPASSEVEIIYNGVDTRRLQTSEPKVSTRARLGIAQNAVVIGYVGRWGPQKNPLAAAQAAGGISGAVALYVGPIPDDRSQVLEAARLASCRFVAPEQVGNIGDLYAAMDFCVFASRSEGFGLAIAEAWYCRIPVVATAVGIAQEHLDLVRLLPDEPTSKDLTDAVQDLLSGGRGPDLEAAREIVERRYDSCRMIRDWRRYMSSRLGLDVADGVPNS